VSRSRVAVTAEVYEVELKFRLADAAAVVQRLESCGARFGPPLEQVDRYFAHPARDFAATDEALRLRRVGDDVAITWKGPRIDAATKTRLEIELPLAAVAPAGAATLARWTDLLERLGFRPVREVAKRRRIARVSGDGPAIEACLDDVAGLGSFLELELVATAAEVDAARARIEALARDLGCQAPERRSYLELLLESDSRP
jgi:adenylate cyclase, class 2